MKFLLLNNARGLLFALLATFSLGKMQAGIEITSNIVDGAPPAFYYPAETNDVGIDHSNENVKNMAAWSIVMSVLASMQSDPDTHGAFALVAKVAGDLAGLGDDLLPESDSTIADQLIAESFKILTDDNKIVFEGDAAAPTWAKMKTNGAKFTIKEIKFFSDLISWIDAAHLDKIAPLFDATMPAEMSGSNLAKLRAIFMAIEKEESDLEGKLSRITVEGDSDFDDLTTQAAALKLEVEQFRNERQEIETLLSEKMRVLSSEDKILAMTTKIREIEDAIQAAREAAEISRLPARGGAERNADEGEGLTAGEVSPDTSAGENDSAATKIQSMFRRFKARKLANQEKEFNILDALLSNEEDKLPAEMKNEDDEVAALRAKLSFLTQVFNNPRMLKARLEKLSGQPVVQASSTPTRREIRRPVPVDTTSAKQTPTNSSPRSRTATPRSITPSRSRRGSTASQPEEQQEQTVEQLKIVDVDPEDDVAIPSDAYQFSYNNDGVARVLFRDIAERSNVYTYAVSMVGNNEARIIRIKGYGTGLSNMQDDEGNVLVFSSREAARNYLSSQGSSEPISGSEIDAVVQQLEGRRFQSPNKDTDLFQALKDPNRFDFFRKTSHGVTPESLAPYIPNDQEALTVFRQALLDSINENKNANKPDTFAYYNTLAPRADDGRKLRMLVDEVNKKGTKLKLKGQLVLTRNQAAKIS